MLTTDNHSETPRNNTLSTVSTAVASQLRTFLLAMKVFGSEFKWIIIAGLRNWEIAQLRKRLTQEYRNLGMIEAVGAGLDLTKNDQELALFDEKELTIKQIAFLLDEIAYLKAQLLEERQEYVRRRVSKWKLTA
ncbi:hypothetical protein [Desulfonatronum thioautotrophicum]|uniref:hypothetical protein n=1 Tax=Desulfonatronum thioautotrophicum TaxID=617001 RepID=UPI00069C7662|nr:hypothetical protein [Desulfonatronum thioautotrophicum]